MDVDVFIAKWSGVALSERAHAQGFILQLCKILGVAAPGEDGPAGADYRFERSVRRDRPTPGGRHIDCYKRGSFVLECKQSDARGRTPGAPAPRRGSPLAVDRTMRDAKLQAEAYARALDEWPPFLIFVDVGRSIELWSDFSRQGKAYVPFPNQNPHRIQLADLARPEIGRMLAAVWDDPMSLDPDSISIPVTTEISRGLGGLLQSLCARHDDGDAQHRAARASKASAFVMQCVLAMFADSVGLIRHHAFRDFLEGCRGEAEAFHFGAIDVFKAMDGGGYSAALRQVLRPCGGGLFRGGAHVQITEDELSVLIDASRKDWSMVEPSIFGALLEAALEPGDRADAGIHFTPRAYVETLVEATVLEPLRQDWRQVERDALDARARGDEAGALRMVRDFHRSLLTVRVLDPACGTGNFLYVTLDMMKALESEVLLLKHELGGKRRFGDRRLIGPGQFRGIERNVRAAQVGEIVMWIGHLQWRLRHAGRDRPAALPRNTAAIQIMDALLVTRPDLPPRDLQTVEPRRPRWPAADFIVGNPPFMGAKDQRRELGDAYVDALWAVRQGRFRSADLVACWWDRAAEILAAPGSRLRRFGFITTNSIVQPLSRRVIEHHLNATPPIRLTFVIPDHPWPSGGVHACVRVAMSVAERGEPDGQAVLREMRSDEPPAGGATGAACTERRGVIGAEFTLGPRAADTMPLRANAGLASRGVQLMGAGFIVDEAMARRLTKASAPGAGSPFRPYRNGRDLTTHARPVQVIDLFGHDEAAVRERWPGIYQHLLQTVKPGRQDNHRAAYRRRWWVFGEPRIELRAALGGLDRYIVTVETGKHRWFRFLTAEILADNRLVCIASDDAFVLGVLSSRTHLAWAHATGGRLEDRPVYSKSVCFDRFPFPDAGDDARQAIGALAAELDRLRTTVLARNPALTMTALYNAREDAGGHDLRRPRESHVYDTGCVAVIDALHREIDAGVLAAYGWPAGLDDEEVVRRLAALNRQRAAAERAGDVLFLRPDFQTGEMRAAPRSSPVGIEWAA